jgi:putative ubiquitin-RnfH superfamily antitoxin RatB of RatAB toxin-antitoxin module
MAPAEGAATPLRIEVAYCPAPGRAELVELRLPPGALLRDAISASGLAQRHELSAQPLAGVWGKLRPLDSPLRDLDRVELYRALRVDPKEARRLRYKRSRPAKAK